MVQTLCVIFFPFLKNDWIVDDTCGNLCVNSSTLGFGLWWRHLRIAAEEQNRKRRRGKVTFQRRHDYL